MFFGDFEYLLLVFGFFSMAHRFWLSHCSRTALFSALERVIEEPFFGVGEKKELIMDRYI
jgi:hypothetical protein